MAEAEALAGEIGGRAVSSDLSDPGATDRLIDDVLAREGRIDALVNNAAGLEQGPDGGRDAGPSRHDRGEPDRARRADGPDAGRHGAGRRDREHLLAQRHPPAHRRGRLHRDKGRSRCRHRRLRAGARAARHPGECRGAGADREAGGAAPEGDRGDGGEGDAAGPHRQARGYRGCGGVPPVGGCGVHHRAGSGGQRGYRL
jgi:hypothetical protein